MPTRCHAEYGDYGVTLSRIKSMEEAFAICGFFTGNGVRALITEPASPFDYRVFVAQISRSLFDRLAYRGRIELLDYRASSLGVAGRLFWAATHE